MFIVKRKLFIILCFILIVQSFLVHTYAVDETSEGIYNRLQEIKKVYPDDSYFTVDGGICTSNEASNCHLKEIPARGGLSTGSKAASVCGDGWSCCGFARYVFYNIFYHKAESSTYSKTVSIDNAKPGDFVVFSGHYGIFISADSNYVYVYDSNFTTTPTNRVGWKTKITRSRVSKIWHSKSYDEYNSEYSDVKTLKVYFNANGGSIDSDTYKLSNNLVCNISDGSKKYQPWVYNNKKTNGLVNYGTFGLYKTGYTFVGWGTKASGGTIFDQDDTSLLPTDINPNVANGDCSTTLSVLLKPIILKLIMMNF